MNEFPKVEKLEKSYHAEAITEFDEKILDSIVEIENDCFPKEWNLWESEEVMRKYYSEALKDEKAISVILKDSEKVVGYILAVPHDEAVSDLIDYDPEMKEDEGRYYIETAGILQKYKGIRGAVDLNIAICEEAKKRGVTKFSCHARKANKLNERLKKLFEGMITKSRNIDKWGPAGDESFEYLEWTYNK